MSTDVDRENSDAPAGGRASRQRPASGLEMPLGDHLEELRRRLVLALFGIVPALIFGLVVGNRVLGLLLEPARQALRAQWQPDQVIATAPAEAFLSYFTVAILLAILIASPWILYQGWLFIAPGLYAGERRFVYVLIPMSTVLTVCSVLFLYFVMVPITVSFFVGFGAEIPSQPPGSILDPGPLATVPVLDGDPAQPVPGTAWINLGLRQLRFCINEDLILGTALSKASGIVAQYRVSEFLKFVLMLAAGLAIAFQTPVIVLLLGWAGIIKREWLVRYRRYIIMACLVISAVLTPSDVLSMVLLAVPLYALFELGSALLIVLPASRIAGPREPDGDAEQDERA